MFDSPIAQLSVHFAEHSEAGEMAELEETETPIENMLRITPHDFINFQRGDHNEVTFQMKCISKFPVTYKIQTTSPAKFRVHPRCGMLCPGDIATIRILLKQDQCLSDSPKDKFLIMAMALPSKIDTHVQALTDYWKQKGTNNPDVEQHRLACTYKEDADCEPVTTTRSPSGKRVSDKGEGTDERETGKKRMDPNVMDLSKHAKKLESQLKYTQILQCITLIFMMILSAAVIYLLQLHQSPVSPEGPLESLDIETTVEELQCPKGRHL